MPHIHIHLYRADDAFEENKHPRGAGGKFASGGTHEHRMHELSSRRLDEEIEKASKRASTSTSALINAGRGLEKYSETKEKAKQGDPLALEHVHLSNEERALMEHRAERARLGEKFVRRTGQKKLEEMKQKQ